MIASQNPSNRRKNSTSALDYNRPMMDGITMLQRRREDAVMRHTPVIPSPRAEP